MVCFIMTKNISFYYRIKSASDSNIKLEMYVNKLELYVNGVFLDTVYDRKILSQTPLRDKTVVVAKVTSTKVQIKVM